MSKKTKKYQAYLIASTFVFEVLFTIGVFSLVGYLIDSWLDTVIFTIIFAILGVFAGIYNLIRKANKVNKDETE